MDMLREVAKAAASKHPNELLEREDFSNICKKNGEISTTIFRATLHAMNDSSHENIEKQCKVVYHIDPSHALEVLFGIGSRTVCRTPVVR